MMRQIPTQMDDSELKGELFKMAVPYKDVRLVKDRNTGLNRGFAFIEFNNVEDASSWMQTTKVITLYHFMRIEKLIKNRLILTKTEKF